jgi:hypothetical protein
MFFKNCNPCFKWKKEFFNDLKIFENDTFLIILLKKTSR